MKKSALIIVGVLYCFAQNMGEGAGEGIAVPMHYGSIVGSAEDARLFSDALKGKIQVVILPQE